MEMLQQYATSYIEILWYISNVTPDVFFNITYDGNIFYENMTNKFGYSGIAYHASELKEMEISHHRNV